MRHIDRLEEPEILASKKDEWLQKFLASGKKRPDSSKYGNPNILQKLKDMSYNKCFYSEASITATPSNVDHLMEVALDKTKAFEWDNLYLSLQECNVGRPNNNEIPIAEVLDPCRDSDDEIRTHLSFDFEKVIPKDGSEKGRKTIAKFRLNHQSLLLRRIKCLSKLYEFIEDKQKEREQDGRVSLSDAEKAAIKAWASPDREFSLMVEVCLKKRFPEWF